MKAPIDYPYDDSVEPQQEHTLHDDVSWSELGRAIIFISAFATLAVIAVAGVAWWLS